MGQSQGKRKITEEGSTEGASTSSFISPEATGVGSGQYDVFLSFRGSDTRKAFTDHLYHSLIKAGTVPLPVFRDENSIPIGEEFGSKILDAIARSKISIPIISENYASSKWCLRELVRIMDCKKSTSHIVLPIFYKVAPSDVRHLKGNFGNAFHSSQERFDEKDIQEGQQALNEVSYLNGWESEKCDNGHEGKLIECVVETVTSKLQEDFLLDVPKQLVGLDGHMKEIMNWIDSPSTNARMIGIYGMGGIGKTTLAKCIYNQLLNKFMHVSFLPDVRETSRHRGITYLQSQLISDILKEKEEVSRINDGINIIKSRFIGKKVLILLDDIGDKKQLNALAREHNWFMARSMIIVTTRNKVVLDQSKFEVVYKYELKELDEVQALLLFKQHAFRMEHSLRDFEGISRDIISTLGGQPLAIEIVGSCLYGKTNRKVWEELREKLKNQPHSDVQKTLQISYDALQDGHKQIFLDLVCFFIGVDGKDPMYMWEGCGLYPSLGIEELKLRCLIKIGYYDEFEMHDQLRDLGRSIFCQGQPHEERSGPWDRNYKGVSRVVRDLQIAMDGGQSQGKRERAEEESIEGTSTSSPISPVPTGVGSGQYDVFLSFRGSDTRKTFTDHLYHSLIKAGAVPFCVFRDENNIPIGEEFGPEILNAIARSKISIPIISENYAASKWCLRELIHIMDRKKTKSHIVMPIFYKVDPSDVRYLKGSFGKAFHSRKKRFDEKDIQEGQLALREVSDLHGWESEKFANGSTGSMTGYG